MPNINLLLSFFFLLGGAPNLENDHQKNNGESQKVIGEKPACSQSVASKHIIADEKGKGTQATGMMVALCRLSKKAIQGLGRASRGVD